MRTTGIVRKVDELGRVVLPVELRRTLQIEERDCLEISLSGETILLQKQQNACIFCGAKEDLTSFSGKQICASCRKALCEQE